jgi:hypothetical protein
MAGNGRLAGISGSIGQVRARDSLLTGIRALRVGMRHQMCIYCRATGPTIAPVGTRSQATGRAMLFWTLAAVLPKISHVH